MPRPSKTPHQKAEMRRHIREAFSQLAKKNNIAPGDVYGYRQITIRDIIKEAGISIGTFYKYFDNRDDLGQSLWMEPVEKLRAEMQKDYDLEEDPLQKIRVLLDHYARFSIQNPRIFKAAFLFVGPDNHSQRNTVDLEQEVFFTNLRDALEEGQRNGIFKSFSTHKMAQTMWAGIHGALGLPTNLSRYQFDDATDLSHRMIEALISIITK